MPIVVPAPGLLSITTGWPRRGASFSPIERATMSTPPPGGKGTTKRIGFAGYCASAAAGASARKTARMQNRVGVFIRTLDTFVEWATEEVRCDLPAQHFLYEMVKRLAQ